MLQGRDTRIPWPISFGVGVNSITGGFIVDGGFSIRALRAS
jgi:predicted sugar kinase